MQKYISLGIFSASSLALEITLTRLLSTLYYPPFVFVVISLAIFGIALGAAWVALEEFLRYETRLPFWIATTAGTVIVQVATLPFAATLPSPILITLLLILPFVGVGVSIACIFTFLSQSSQTLYAYDLAGAGIGAIFVIPLLNVLNPLNAMLLIAVIMLTSAWLYRFDHLFLGLIPIGIVLLTTNVLFDFFAVDIQSLSTEKPIQAALANGGTILETRWDSFARTDLVRPGANQPYRIYVDGAAASVIPPAQANNFLLQDIGFFAFATAQPENVFIIGSGGGLDVWFGLQADASNITAVEVNPQSVEVVQDFASYSGDIYNHPSVTVLIDEGRSVLSRDNSIYDLIYLSQVVTLATERSGYALTENAVFTVEAFQEYWEHLSNEGYLALKLYDEPTLSRALSLVIELLNQQGLSDADALHHTITLLSPNTSPPTPLLLARRTAFTSDESLAIGRNAQEIGFVPLYLPHVLAEPPLDALENGTNSFDDIVEASAIDITAPTDNRPFFYQFEYGIPQDLTPLLIATSVVLGLLIVGLFVVSWQLNPPKLVSVAIYFAMLGTGFMLIEVVFIQTTRLFIGHPTLAITATLSAILIGGGLGSAWYQRVNAHPKEIHIGIFLGIIFAVIIWIIVWDLINTQFISSPTVFRVLLVCITIIPIAFLMGIPFAMGLRLVDEFHEQYVAIAWTINGVFTVVGTVFGVVLALIYGYFLALIVGVLCYGVALIASRFLKV